MTKETNKGFALLYTSLLATLLLSLSISMGYIIRKELILSSMARESQKAFYMADSSAECALYWDFKHDVFNITSATTSSSITCQGVSLANSELSGARYDGVPGLGGASVTRFEIENPSGKTCAIVTVTKSNTAPRTKIEAEGYNTLCNSDSRIRLQRAVRLQY